MAAFGYSASAIKIKEHSLEIKNKKAAIENSGVDVEIQNAIKLVL